MPLRSPTRSPAIRPKEWNTGSGLNSTSAGASAPVAWPAIWRALATRLAFESTTAFGTPSEPEVKRITAASSGLRPERAATRRDQKALGEPGELVEARQRGAQILDEDD